MAKRKKNREERKWEELEWCEGDIKAKKVDSQEEVYFLALKGNPLVVRTMTLWDLDAVFKEYNTNTLNAKEIKKIRRDVAQGSAAIIEVAEEWTPESTALEIATQKRVIAGIGHLNEQRVECTLERKYSIYTRFLQELITYIGVVKSKGKMPILTTSTF